MPEEMFDPEDSQWIRRIAGTLAPGAKQRHQFSTNRPFRPGGFVVEKGGVARILQMNVGLSPQLIRTEDGIPVSVMNSIMCEVCPVGSYVELWVKNPLTETLEYDFRVVGWETV